MRITVVAVGKKLPSWANQGVGEYSKRISAELPLTIIEVAPAKRNKSVTRSEILGMEADRIQSALPKHTYRVALDQKGREFTTRALADNLYNWMRDGQDLAFIIGGADGLDPALISAADEVWALSKLTLPHALVRIFLAEQIYRAWTILHNHPYHRV